MALQITDKQSAFASRFSSGLLFETMWHCDMDCKMRFITCQWSLAVCSLGLLMRGSRQSSALARSSAWRWTPMDHNSGAGQETRNCRVGGFSLSLWGRLAAGGPNLPVKNYLCTWLFHGCLCWNESRLWLDLIIFLPPHNPPTRRGLPRLDWIPYLSSYYLTLPVTDKWSISATDGTRWPK